MSEIVAADWRPTASLATLRLRAALLQRARQYFAADRRARGRDPDPGACSRHRRPPRVARGPRVRWFAGRVPAHVTRIRDEATALRGRARRVPGRARVPRGRARPQPQSRIHDARVVPARHRPSRTDAGRRSTVARPARTAPHCGSDAARDVLRRVRGCARYRSPHRRYARDRSGIAARRHRPARVSARGSRRLAGPCHVHASLRRVSRRTALRSCTISRRRRLRSHACAGRWHRASRRSGARSSWPTAFTSSGMRRSSRSASRPTSPRDVAAG